MLVNANRPQCFLATFQAALRYHLDTLQALRALRGIYFGIAEITGRRTAGPPQERDLEEQADLSRPSAVPRRCEFEDVIPVGWVQLATAGTPDLPADFIAALCRFVFVQDASADQAFEVTWLELVFMLEAVGGFVYPVAGQSGWVSSATVAFLPPPPTVAGRLSLVRRAFRGAFKGLRLQSLFVSGIDRSDLGIGFPLDGLVFGVDGSLQAPLIFSARTHWTLVCTALALQRPRSPSAL